MTPQNVLALNHSVMNNATFSTVHIFAKKSLLIKIVSYPNNKYNNTSDALSITTMVPICYLVVHPMSMSMIGIYIIHIFYLLGTKVEYMLTCNWFTQFKYIQ